MTSRILRYATMEEPLEEPLLAKPDDGARTTRRRAVACATVSLVVAASVLAARSRAEAAPRAPDTARLADRIDDAIWGVDDWNHTSCSGFDAMSDASDSAKMMALLGLKMGPWVKLERYLKAERRVQESS